VLTLDIKMPGMDGITFLEKLMRLHPMPVVMISSLTGQGAVSTLRALQLGAVDVVAKPAGGNEVCQLAGNRAARRRTPGGGPANGRLIEQLTPRRRRTG
jgi:two-component system chemotaxis response regulator CheB